VGKGFGKKQGKGKRISPQSSLRTPRKKYRKEM